MSFTNELDKQRAVFTDVSPGCVEPEKLFGFVVRHPVSVNENFRAQVDVIDCDYGVMLVYGVTNKSIFKAVC